MTHNRQSATARTGAVFNSAMLLGAALVVPLVTTSIYSVFLGVGSGTGPLVLATLLLLLIFTVINWRSLLLAVRSNPEITALILLAPISVIWSMHTASTVERSISLLITSAFGLTVGAMLPPRKLIYFFMVVLAITVAASLLAIVLVPSSQGIGSWPDAWNGVHNHKNGLGMATMLTITLSASAAVVSRGWVRRVALAVLLLAIVLQVGSKSRTSQLMTLIAFVGIGTGVLWRRYALLWAVAFSTVVTMLFVTAVFVLGTSFAEPMFEALGRKPTLSGRLPLWGVVWPWVEERPLLGYGYEAFWRPDAPHVVGMASNPELFFSPFYSHNGVLEILLAVGGVGLGILLLGIWKAFAALLAVMRYAQDRQPAACMYVILVGLLTLNITESFLLSRTSTGWMMFVAVTTNARLAAREFRIRMTPAAIVGAPLPA